MDIIVPDNSHKYDHSVYVLPDIINPDNTDITIPDNKILSFQKIQSRILSFQITQSQIL